MENSYLSNQLIQKRKWIIACAVGLFSFMAFLDSSIVNIAIPVISKSLAITNDKAEQIVSLYIMVLCMCSLLFGKLGDKFGVIKIFKIGTIIFIVGSFLSGLRFNIDFLLFSRVIQGLGASMTLSTNYAIITKIFPEDTRGRALGFIGTFVSLGAIAGSGVGGLILTYFSYSYIFWINIPIGIVAVLIGFIVLPKDNSFIAEKIDYLGFLFSAIGIFGLFQFAIHGQTHGYFNLISLIGLMVGIIFIILFILREYRIQNPLLDFKMFRNSMFTISLICLFLIFATTYFYNMIMPFYLEDALKLDNAEAGLLLMAYPITMCIFAFIAGWSSDKFGAKITTFIGLVMYMISQIIFVFFNLDSSILFFIVISVLMGISYALFQSPNNVLIMSSALPQYLGSAGSIKSLFQYLGSFIGISFSTSTLYLIMSIKAGHQVLSYEPTDPMLFISGMQGVFVVSAIISVIALTMSGIRIFRKKSNIKIT